MKVYLKNIGIAAPGIKDWQQAKAIFTQLEAYSPMPMAKKLSSILPANEQRRASRVTQLAIHVAQQLLLVDEVNKTESSNNALNQCLQVFSSSNGDLSTFHHISQALTLAGRPVSPTRFHNSVHNAPSGYWSIANQNTNACTSLAVYSDSFSAGLLEAMVQLKASDNIDKRDVLLVCYDELPPTPFRSHIPIATEFACALRLSLDNTQAICTLDISPNQHQQDLSKLKIKSLASLAQANPQAIVLPLLEAIAQIKQINITLPYFEKGLAVNIQSYC